MKLQKHIRLAFILLSIILLMSCGNHGNSIPIEKWSILKDRTDSPVAVPRKDGRVPIELPFLVKVSSPEEKDFSFIWLMGEFTIEADPCDYDGISTGRIRYSDETYINKIRIGSISHETVNWAPQPRNYEIPQGTLIKGRNTVLIRIGIYDKYFGGLMGPVFVQSGKEFKRERLINNFIYRQMPFGIAVLLAGITITMLITYFWNRKEKLYIIVVIPLIVSVFYIFFPCLETRVLGYELYLVANFCLTPIFIIIFIILMQSLYRMYLSNFNRILIPIMLILIITAFLFRDETCNEIIGLIIIAVSTAIFIPFFIYMMKILNSIKPDKFLYAICHLMFFILLFIIISETYWGITGGLHSAIVSTFAPILFIVIGAFITSRELNKIKKDLNTIYYKFKHANEREIMVTASQEEKIKGVIDFLNENYTSDLVKEGLASAFGTTPNYFAKLFKIYTGKSINEYINNLRINYAIEQLKTKEIKIVDIAYKAGFESIVTFNRKFKKVTGKTPSEYRKDL